RCAAGTCRARPSAGAWSAGTSPPTSRPSRRSRSAERIAIQSRPMLLAHHPERIAALRAPTAGEPWRVLVSGCLAGLSCGVDGTDYGMKDALAARRSLPTVARWPFCPEDYGIGTPRTMPDIHGGDGFDVLDGNARVF